MEQQSSIAPQMVEEVAEESRRTDRISGNADYDVQGETLSKCSGQMGKKVAFRGSTQRGRVKLTSPSPSSFAGDQSRGHSRESGGLRQCGQQTGTVQRAEGRICHILTVQNTLKCFLELHNAVVHG